MNNEDYMPVPQTHVEMASGHGIGRDCEKKIDSKNQRFPYCIVWTPIPLLTWLVSVRVRL